MKKLLIGISGASGAPIAVRLLQQLEKNPVVETHLVITKGGKITIEHETSLSVHQVQKLADVCYENEAIWESPASGSYRMDGMIVAPCSMKTVAGIHSGYSDNLLLRAADVTLKERRKLVLVARESPLSTIHLRNMYELSQMGVIIMPPMLTCYNHASTIEECIDEQVERILRQLELESSCSEWKGVNL